MTLELQGVSRSVGGKMHIHPTDLRLENGTMNVFLGPTLSGKTSLMRLMAGLDKPTHPVGRHGRDGPARAGPQGRHGLPAVHQLSRHDRP
jgi:ABC-type multidrug transport system ATPase subunit